MIDGINWLRDNKFTIKIAGRSLAKETSEECRMGYGRLFQELELKLNPDDPDDLVIFPEMDPLTDVPEITENAGIFFPCHPTLRCVQIPGWLLSERALLIQPLCPALYCHMTRGLN